MKSIIFLTIMLSAFAASAQTDSSLLKYRSRHNEIGVDINPLLDRILHFDFDSEEDNGFTQSTHFLTYKRGSEKIRFRLSLGGSYRTDDNAPGDGLDYQFYSAAIKSGVEFTTYFGKRWMLFYGADLTGSTSRSVTEDMFTIGATTKHTNRSISYGVAPLVGLQFILNSRLSFSTEASLPFYMGSAKETFEYENNPAATDTDTRRFVGVGFNYPVFVKFNVRF